MLTATLVVAFLSSVAHAQLLLSGRASGAFVDLGSPNTTITNSADGSSALFETGVPAWEGETQSWIQFTGKSFTDAGSGLLVEDLFTIKNGRTVIGSAAGAAEFDLAVKLTSPTTFEQQLSTIHFTIDNTDNIPTDIPDVFTLSWTPIDAFELDGYRVQFAFSAPMHFQILEDSMMSLGDLSVTLTPIPEPSTYAAAGVLLLFGLVGYRRWRRVGAGDHVRVVPKKLV